MRNINLHIIIIKELELKLINQKHLNYVKRWQKKEFELTKDLAEKEYLNGQFQLGCYYHNGIGTEFNKSKALELYKIAAEKGHIVAQYNLGIMYQIGEGVYKNENKAFELMKDLA